MPFRKVILYDYVLVHTVIFTACKMCLYAVNSTLAHCINRQVHTITRKQITIIESKQSDQVRNVQCTSGTILVHTAVRERNAPPAFFTCDVEENIPLGIPHINRNNSRSHKTNYKNKSNFCLYQCIIFCNNFQVQIN